MNSQSVAETALQINAKGFSVPQWDHYRFSLDKGGSLPVEGMKICSFLLVFISCYKPWPCGWEAQSMGSLDHWNTSISSYFWHSIINVSNYVSLYQLWLYNKTSG